jgi:hypothetical protein
MRDSGDSGAGYLTGARSGHLLLAESLGLAMARRAAEILDRHRAVLAAAAVDPPGPEEAGTEEGVIDASDDAEFAADNAIFTAVLDAANECLGRYDNRPADDRWCDALLHLLYLAQSAALEIDPRGA